MKRLLFVVAGLLVSLNLAYANDLLFKASNGALNQNSVGVKKLTDKEMAQVKGGTYMFIERPYIAGQFISTNRYGQRVWYKEYYLIIPTQNDTPAMHSFFNWLTTVDPVNEIVTIEATYNFATRQVESKFVVVNTQSRVHRYSVINHPISQRIYQTHRAEAEQQIYQNRYNAQYY